MLRVWMAFFPMLLCVNLHSQTDFASTFSFPTGIRNLWQYKEPPPADTTITQVRTGRDTTFSNGKTYRIFVSNIYGYSDTLGIEYKRQVGDSVYQYFPDLQIEALIYDFSKKIGDTVSIFPRRTVFGMDTSVVTVLDAGTQSTFGKMRKYVKFYDRTIHATLYWIDQITDSLGVTFSQVEPGFQLSLVGAVIDGNQYGTIVNVPEARQNIPSDFVLLQNYPNPFNPSTTICYSLPHRSHVYLTIFNTLGQQVAQLVNNDQEVGNYNVRFDGSGFASGVYFYRLQAGDFVQTKELILLR